MAVVAWAWWSPAWAATKAGDAQVVTPAEGTSAGGLPLTGGSAATPFTLQLPSGASCRGDSANDGYRVQTYMVPERIDPATLQFGSVGPVPVGTGTAFRQPLFKTTSDPVVNTQTAAATRTPGPGPIVNIPAMNFSVYREGDIPAGTYNVGVACTKGPASPTQLDTYWNTKLVVTAAPGTAAAAITWTVPSPPAAAAPVPAGPPGEVATAVEAAAATASPGATARSIPSTVSEVSRPKLSLPVRPSGAPPSLGLPAADLASYVRRVGDSRLAIAVSTALALVALRIAFLLTRRPQLVAALP